MNKAMQRALAREARLALDAETRRRSSAAVCEQLLALPELAGVKTVFSYMAMEGEADLGVLHEQLLARGLRLAFPVCGKGGQMDFYEPAGWKRGPFGIREPDPALSRLVGPGEADLLLIPCVAFDEGCARLGHGAGFYDRYLPRCPRARTVLAAFEAQKLPAVITEDTDVPVDLVVTEAAVYRRG